MGDLWVKVSTSFVWFWQLLVLSAMLWELVRRVLLYSPDCFARYSATCCSVPILHFFANLKTNCFSTPSGLLPDFILPVRSEDKTSFLGLSV
jgi:hypothetical protein